jgi:hypothetical protein
MEPKVRIIRPGEQEDKMNTPTMQLVERITGLLDSKFVIPGTNIRFGIDPLLSLFPVLGDLATYFVSAILIYMMHTQGASRKVVIKMMLNSTFDAVLGAIPLVGTFFDIFYRSNERNVRLLKEHYFEGKHEGSGNGMIAGIAIVCFIIVAAAFYGMYKLIELLF